MGIRSVTDEIFDRVLNELYQDKGFSQSKIEKIESHGSDLISSGLMDSLGFLQFITRLEEELEIEIDLSEYDPEEFTRVDKLRNIISQLKDS